MSKLLLYKTCENFKQDTIKCQDCLARNGCLDYKGVDATIVLHIEKQCIVDYCMYNHETKCLNTNRQFETVVEHMQDCPIFNQF